MALIFVSGLREASIDQTFNGTSRRIAVALGRNAKSGSAKFAVHIGTQQANLGDGCTVEHGTIVRSDSDTAVDVWRLSTASILTSDYSAAGPIRKALLGLLVTLRYIPKTRLFLRRRAAKTLKERGQFLMAVILLLLVGTYLVALAVVLAASFADANWMPSWASSVLLTITGLGIWKAGIVQQLTDSAVEAHCVLQYLDWGYRADVLRGHLAQLLEHLAEQDDAEYDQVDIIAYSFGAIVAIDTFYPAAHVPGPRFEQVNTLVTIAHPFDLISTYFPKYFAKRRYRDGVPKRWLNVCSPLDVLGSDFLDGDLQERGVEFRDDTVARPENQAWATAGHTDRDISPLEVFLMVGVRAHAMYWGFNCEQEDTVFGPIVHELYGRHALLA